MHLTTEELDGLVTWTLIRAARRIERNLTELFADVDLTPIQFGVLAHLATGEPMTQADLARAVLLRPQSMAQLTTGMVERGLLVRTGARGKGRANPLALSAQGSALLVRVWPVVRAANDLTPAGLGASRTDELNATLHAVLGWAAGTALDVTAVATTSPESGMMEPEAEVPPD